MKEEDLIEQSLIKEIESELRDEQIAKLWDKWKNHILGGIALIVVLSFASSTYKAHQRDKILTESKSYISALLLQEKGNNNAATQKLKSLANKETNYGVLAALGSNDAAALKDISAKNSSLNHYKTYVYVMGAIETEKKEALLAALSPLLSNPGWKGLALEAKSFIEIQSGDLTAAKASLNSLLTVPQISEALRQRATNLLSVLNAKQKTS